MLTGEPAGMQAPQTLTLGSWQSHAARACSSLGTQASGGTEGEFPSPVTLDVVQRVGGVSPLRRLFLLSLTLTETISEPEPNPRQNCDVQEEDYMSYNLLYSTSLSSLLLVWLGIQGSLFLSTLSLLPSPRLCYQLLIPWCECKFTSNLQGNLQPKVASVTERKKSTVSQGRSSQVLCGCCPGG